MAEGIRPIRRVVTGNDAQGRSCVLVDSSAPGVKASAFKKGTGMTDIWKFDTCPALISGNRDDGNIPFHFEPPSSGGRVRIVESQPKPADYDPAQDTFITRRASAAQDRRRNVGARASEPLHDADTQIGNGGLRNTSVRRARARHRCRRACPEARRHRDSTRKLARMGGSELRQSDGVRDDGG